MAPLPDEIKKQKIIEQLVWNDSVNANEISVKVNGNTVLLEGTVPNYATKISAAADANLVSGINTVENNLKVEFPITSNLPDDDEITKNIKNQLQWNSKIVAHKIEVSTKEGIVTLSGKTDSLWEKNEAEKIVNEVYGVIEVVNKLEVELSRSVNDLEIEKDIRKSYERSILINENKIDIQVGNGTVHLTGSVANYPIKKEAIDVATYTKGVINVVGDISIE